MKTLYHHGLASMIPLPAIAGLAREPFAVGSPPSEFTLRTEAASVL